MATLKAYECGVKGSPYKTTVHAATAGKARYSYFLDLDGCYPDIGIIDITVRSLGLPRNTDGFRHTAKYRGVPHWNVGDQVTVGGKKAQLCGKTPSACFEVMYTDGPLAGKTAIYHPAEITHNLTAPACAEEGEGKR